MTAESVGADREPCELAALDRYYSTSSTVLDASPFTPLPLWLCGSCKNYLISAV